jgi:hypothetical protein
MNTVHEARFYEKLSDGGRGACGVRYNDRGSLCTLVYDKVIAREVNPIEKKPFYHFHPASYAYSIATVGCKPTVCLMSELGPISMAEGSSADTD